jgi:AraC family transcriptional regulator, regulatory protein of adaptative response / methylated-DNA-[protein]-cysteine methyltransferase
LSSSHAPVAIASSAFFCAESLLKILSLKANIGVWARARARSFDHEDKRRSDTMNLMTSEAALRLLPAEEPANTAADVLFFGVGDSALGKVLLARSAKGVCTILLGDDAGDLEADLAGRFPETTLVANEVMVRDDLAKVVRYAEKPSEGLALTLDMRGTPLQRRIWEQIRAIPVGKTMSYMHLARLINNVYPKVAARAVANACAANPIALAVPCHRVIRTDGELAGYRWGIERKRDLIEKEALHEA